MTLGFVSQLQKTTTSVLTTGGAVSGLLIQGTAALAAAELVRRLLNEGREKVYLNVVCGKVKEWTDWADNQASNYPSWALRGAADYTGLSRAYRSIFAFTGLPNKGEVAKTALACFIVSTVIFEAAHYFGGVRYDLINNFHHLQVRAGSVLRPVYHKLASAVR